MNFEKPNTPQSDRGSRIESPNGDIRFALSEKLSEYYDRLRSMRPPVVDPFAAPEIGLRTNKDFDSKDTQCKIFILEALLKSDRGVNKKELFEAFREKYSNIGENTFDSAFRVLQNYVEAGGRGVVGGTGLRVERKEANQDPLINFVETILRQYNGNEGLMSSGKFYSKEELLALMKRVLNGELDIDYIPNCGFGLRGIFFKKFSDKISRRR